MSDEATSAATVVEAFAHAGVISVEIDKSGYWSTIWKTYGA